MDGRRNFKGTLIGLEDGHVVVTNPDAKDPWRFLNAMDTSVSFQFRIFHWKRAVQMIRWHPVFGVGARRYDNAANQVWPIAEGSPSA